MWFYNGLNVFFVFFLLFFDVTLVTFAFGLAYYWPFIGDLLTFRVVLSVGIFS